jgi:hypothetical protein
MTYHEQANSRRADMKTKLTIRAVKANARKPADSPYEVRDTEVSGFLLRVQPSGVMSYYLDYKTPEGKRKRIRIGKAGKDNLTPEQARDIAKRLVADVAHGKDVQAEKQKVKLEAEQAKVCTLGGFLENKYISWVQAEHKSSRKTLSHIQANFGFLIDKPLGEITPWIIEKWRVESRKAGKTATAINRSVASLRAALSKALDWGLLDIHPLAKLKPIKTDNNGKVRTYPPTKKSGSGQPWISGKPASVKNG